MEWVVLSMEWAVCAKVVHLLIREEMINGMGCVMINGMGCVCESRPPPQ